MANDEYLVDDVMVALLVIISVISLYVIVRMLINRLKGNDELDGLL